MLYIIFAAFALDSVYNAFRIGFETKTYSQVWAVIFCLWNAAAAGTLYALLP